MSTSCTVNRKEFLAALNSVSRFVPKRSPKPILTAVRFNLNGCLELSGTDMESAAVASCEHNGTKNGADAMFCIEPNRLSSLLKACKDDTVALSHSDNVLNVATYSGATQFACMISEGKNAAEDFPVVGGSETFERIGIVDANILRDLIRATEYATETQSSRYALGGILIEMKRAAETDGEYVPAKFLRGVGTDGRRLAVYGKRDFTPDVTAIVPGRFCKHVGQLLKGATLVYVMTSANQIRFEISYGGDRLTVVAQSRLVEGRFPKWRDVIPSRTDSLRCYLETERMIPILKDAAGFVSDESRGLDFVWTAGELSVLNSTAEIGTFSRKYGVVARYKFGHVVEFDLTIALDVRFVLEWFESLKAQNIQGCEADFVNGDLAAQFTADDELSVSIIMPLARDRR